jgi:hypothetical protein
MVGVSTDVRLQQHSFTPARNSAAIDEVLRHMADFGDVRMRRDVIAIRQNKPWEGAWMLVEDRAEIR